MEEKLIDNQSDINPSGIPMFLKVLCILTFVGAGLAILSSLLNLLLYETLQSMFSSGPFVTREFSALGDILEETKKWNMINYALAGTGSVFGLIGALMMWKLRKIGFYLYVFGQVLALTGSVVVSIGMSKVDLPGPMGNSSPFIGMVFSFLICIAFVIMYGVNFKHLKN